MTSPKNQLAALSGETVEDPPPTRRGKRDGLTPAVPAPSTSGGPAIGEQRRGSCEGCGAPLTQTWMPGLVEGAHGRWMPGLCGECTGVAKADRAEEERRRVEEEARRTQRLQTAREAFPIPALYREATLANFELHPKATRQEKMAQMMMLDRSQLYLERWPKREAFHPAFPLIVALVGPCGTGKGHVSFGIGREIVHRYQSIVRRVVLPDLVREIQDAYDNRERLAEAELLRPYREADLLIIDEVSTHSLLGDPAKKQAYLYAIIAYREEWMRPTLLTSNEVDGAAAQQLLGPAIVDRINRYRGFWLFDWRSYREVLGERWDEQEERDLAMLRDRRRRRE